MVELTLFHVFSFKDSDAWPSSRPCCNPSSSGSTRSPADHLMDRCHFFLTQGLAPSTRRVYQSVQPRNVDFCRLDGHLSPGGALLPADKQTLMGFAMLFADSLYHSSIKVYLSAAQSVHNENGLADPLINCLQLQGLLRGIKHVQGSSTSKRLPITVDVLQAFNFLYILAPQTTSCSGQHVALVSLVSYVLVNPNIHLAVSDV